MMKRCLVGMILLMLSEKTTPWLTQQPATFSSVQGRRLQRCHRRRHETTTSLSLFWFNNKDEQEIGSSESNNNPNALGGGAEGGGVARVMESMEKFKRTQQVGKLTQNLVQELSSTRVEGTAENGKIKVIVDGQQRPIAVSIDESYWQQQVLQQRPPMDVNDLAAALTQAMQDAHNKAAERMDERMKSYYSELGLKPPT